MNSVKENGGDNIDLWSMEELGNFIILTKVKVKAVNGFK